MTDVDFRKNVGHRHLQNTHIGATWKERQEGEVLYEPVRSCTECDMLLLLLLLLTVAAISTR